MSHHRTPCRLQNDSLQSEQHPPKMTMLKTLWATVRQGKIELLETTEIPEGTKVLVTLLPDDEANFWQQASQSSLNTIWDNPEDDVYAQMF